MGAAVAVIMHKEKELVALFRQGRAVGQASARSLAALGAHEGVALRRLRHRAVIREAAPGLFYLDEPSWDGLNYIRHRLIAVALALILGAMLISGLVLWRR